MILYVGIAIILALFVFGLMRLTPGPGSERPAESVDVLIEVSGWREEELSRILRDFDGMYDTATQGWPRMRLAEQAYRLTGRIEADHLLYLVNYLHYPRGFDLKVRSIRAIGRAEATPALGVPKSIRTGSMVEFFVAGEGHFDSVSIRTEGGQVFTNRCGRPDWRPAPDAKLSGAAV